MKIKTSELSGAALDWAVAVSVGEGMSFARRVKINGYSPSTDWSQGGPLIEQNKVQISPCLSGRWMAETMDVIRLCSGIVGRTPLIAACRAIVAAKLGDVVEVPDELA